MVFPADSFQDGAEKQARKRIPSSTEPWLPPPAFLCHAAPLSSLGTGLGGVIQGSRLGIGSWLFLQAKAPRGLSSVRISHASRSRHMPTLPKHVKPQPKQLKGTCKNDTHQSQSETHKGESIT